MLIKISHKLTRIDLDITTQHDEPDRLVQLNIDPNNQEIIDIFNRELSESYGFYGHLIDLSALANLDLSIAVKQLPSFEVMEITPVIKPNPLPEGAVS